MDLFHGWSEWVKLLSCVRLFETPWTVGLYPDTNLFLLLLFIWLCWVLVVAHWIFDLYCGIWDLVPWPGIEPKLPALGVQSLSHWTTRETPLPILRDKLGCWEASSKAWVVFTAFPHNLDVASRMHSPKCYVFKAPWWQNQKRLQKNPSPVL